MNRVQRRGGVLFFVLLALYLSVCLPAFAGGLAAGTAAAADTPTAGFARAYANSCLVTAANLIVQGLVSVPAGFALSKCLPRRTAGKLRLLCALLMLLPQQALLLPQYLLLDACGLLGRLAGVVLMSAFQPFLVLLFWFGFEQIDTSLLEAAACEGATARQLARFVCLPLLGPYLIAGGLVSAAESWNLLEQPMTFLQADTQPLLGTYFLRAPAGAAAWQGLAAALPMLLLFAAAVKAGPDFGAPAERRKDAQ